MSVPVVLVDKAKCILCYVCEGLAPAIFKQGQTVFVEQAEATKDMDRVRLCEYACPVAAISIEKGV